MTDARTVQLAISDFEGSSGFYTDQLIRIVRADHTMSTHKQIQNAFERKLREAGIDPKACLLLADLIMLGIDSPEKAIAEFVRWRLIRPLVKLAIDAHLSRCHAYHNQKMADLAGLIPAERTEQKGDPALEIAPPSAEITPPSAEITPPSVKVAPEITPSAPAIVSDVGAIDKSSGRLVASINITPSEGDGCLAKIGVPAGQSRISAAYAGMSVTIHFGPA
jgi:hypothetical protein